MLRTWLLVTALSITAAPSVDAKTRGQGTAIAKKDKGVAKGPAKRGRSREKSVEKPPERPQDDPRAAGGENAMSGEVRRGMSRIEFDDRLIQGQTNKANAIYLFERRESALRSLLKKRTHFHEEIDETLE